MTGDKGGLFSWRAISWVLLAMSLALNVFGLGVVQKYREK